MEGDIEGNVDVGTRTGIELGVELGEADTKFTQRTENEIVYNE